MDKNNIKNHLLIGTLIVFLGMHSSLLYAEKRVVSGESSAGFSFATETAAAEPVIHYQQNIQMLANIDDRPSLTVYGDGHVLVHYPVYMKRAGDYEMQLDETELVSLLQSLSADGVIDFDHEKVKQDVRAYKQQLRARGQFYEVSDAVETSIDIRLNEYQKNASSAKIKNFKTSFKWKNIEQDASRYKNNPAISKANNSVSQLNALMKDDRLIDRARR
jgi:hypothetical protein